MLSTNHLSARCLSTSRQLGIALLASGRVAFVLLGMMSGCASRTAVQGASASPITAAQASTDHAKPEGPSDLLSDGGEHIATIHRSKCGACHTPVEPGSLQRDDAQSAMLRHRRRAKLSERDWVDMVEFLSTDGSLHARHTARVP